MQAMAGGQALAGADELNRAFRLDDRVTVITGAASGLGRETARLFALAGARLMLADVDEAGLAETMAMIEAAGGAASARRTDMSRREEVEALADAAQAEAGRLDAWINAAGLAHQAPVLEIDEAQVERVIAVNMTGVYWGCAAAGRVMKAQGGGVIVNVSSGGGDAPVRTLAVYGMTKAAVNMLTRTCALELGEFAIRVNAVAPGWIDTPMGSQLYRNAAGEIDPQLRAQVLKAQARASPLGLTGEPSDVALAILYLASDASRFVTGQVLRVNGGSSM